MFMVDKTDKHIKSSYDHIIIISVYFFLPIAFYGIPSLLGIAVSVLYILYFIVSSLSISEDLTLALHGCYVIYIISLNVLMEAFRIFMEYHLRQMLLRRHQLLHQNFLLKVKSINHMETILHFLFYISGGHAEGEGHDADDTSSRYCRYIAAGDPQTHRGPAYRHSFSNSTVCI